MTDILVACVGEDGSWTCSVRVVGDRPTDHEVIVDEIDLPPSLDGADLEDVERLVRSTFEFLLERESNEAILRRFELAVVERYYPDYPAEIARRVAAA